MPIPTAAHTPLAHAYLALGDDSAPATAQSSLPRAVVALIATLVLALAAPLAWLSAARGELRDTPAATSVNAGHADDDDLDDDDADGDGPGDPWAATNA